MAKPTSTATDAHEHALRALRHRDRSEAELRSWLAQRDVSAVECDEVLETLVRTGLLDDARFAANRARSLAGRGAGDALIRFELGRAGVEDELVEAALANVEPEHVRAEAVVRRRGAGPKTGRYLRSKGFSDDAILAAVAVGPDDALG